MESSQLSGDADEECSSSESGWTMYLASPMHGDANMHDDGGDGEVDQQGHDAVAGCYCESSSGSSNASVGCNELADHDHGEDDSLASDASTGPAQRIKPCSKCDGTPDAMDHPKDDVNDDEIYSQFSSSLRKRKEKVEKRGDGKSPKPFLKGASTSSRTSSKVRRNTLIGK